MNIWEMIIVKSSLGLTEPGLKKYPPGLLATASLSSGLKVSKRYESIIFPDSKSILAGVHCYLGK